MAGAYGGRADKVPINPNRSIASARSRNSKAFKKRKLTSKADSVAGYNRDRLDGGSVKA